MKTINEELPSERILFALAELKKAEQPESEIGICMDDYHIDLGRAGKGLKCYACLGGVAAIGRGFVKISDEFDSLNESIYTRYGNEVAEYEQSLDYARIGSVGEMFEKMNLLGKNGYPFNRHMPDYEVLPTEFKNSLLELANDLQAHGY